MIEGMLYHPTESTPKAFSIHFSDNRTANLHEDRMITSQPMFALPIYLHVENNRHNRYRDNAEANISFKVRM